MSVFDNIKLKGIDPNGEEKEYLLTDFKGTIVLYFYPKDETPGCTVEACDFRDSFNRLTDKATVIGVSPDSVESHKKFQKHHGLNFIMLSDPEHILSKMLGVWQEKSMYGKKYMGINRSTFIIKDGLIVKGWKDVKVKGHVEEIIENL